MSLFKEEVGLRYFMTNIIKKNVDIKLSAQDTFQG